MKGFVALFLLLAFQGLAQKSFPANQYQAADIFFQTHSPAFNAQHVSEADLPEFLKARAGYGEDISLQLFKKIRSKALVHYRYHLYKDGIRIFAAEAHVALDKNQKIKSCKLPFLPEFEGSGFFPLPAIAEDVRLQNGADSVMQQYPVWYTDNSGYLKKGLAVELAGPETLHQEILVSGNEIISQADLHRYYDGPNDSVVTVKVFTPDPLSTARVGYGGMYVDNNDEASPALDNERQIKSLVLTYDNGVFQAENDHVKILDFSAPNVPPVTAVTNQMHYTRDQDGFEDMNVMYHITNHKNHLVNLGFPDIPDYTIEVDPHAINGSDQSFFSTTVIPGRLYFGEGGVDDAEDADVIIHEYMHSAIYVAAPATTTSAERGCIEEALGDYFAASYSTSINTYNAQYVFNWDGHNEFWPGREVESIKDYGLQSFKSGNIYSHTDLFASPLMEMNRNLGRNAADEIILEAIFHLTNNTTMPEMAGHILFCDSILNGGVNYQVIHDAFVRRNILPSTISNGEVHFLKDEIQIFNTVAFASGGPVMVRMGEHNLSSYSITSLNGSIVAAGNLLHTEGEVIEIAAPDIRSGVYVLTLTTTEGYELTHKLSRIH